MNWALVTGGLATVVAAVCCFTPILVVALSAAGFAWMIPHVDAVLLPLLGLSLILFVYGVVKWTRHKSN